MIKYLVGIFCACALFFTSCGSSTKRGYALREWMTPNEQVKVLCTTEMISDIVRYVGDGHVDTLTLICGELDPHSYELVKGDAEKFAVADVVFFNGLGLEHGASLYNQIHLHSHAVRVTRAIPDEALIREGDQIDPHVWMDVSLWKKTIEPVVGALSAERPEYAADFQKRARELHALLEEEDAKITALLHTLPASRRYIVTTHDAFQYFTRRYLSEAEEVTGNSWMSRCSAPEGLAPDSQMSMHDILSICDYLVEHEIPVVFPESNLSPDSLRKVASVCKQRGFPVLICTKPLYGDSVGSKKDNADSYVGMMRSNARTIHSYLSAEVQ